MTYIHLHLLCGVWACSLQYNTTQHNTTQCNTTQEMRWDISASIIPALWCMGIFVTCFVRTACSVSPHRSGNLCVVLFCVVLRFVIRVLCECCMSMWCVVSCCVLNVCLFCDLFIVGVFCVCVFFCGSVVFCIIFRLKPFCVLIDTYISGQFYVSFFIFHSSIHESK